MFRLGWPPKLLLTVLSSMRGLRSLSLELESSRQQTFMAMPSAHMPHMFITRG